MIWRVLQTCGALVVVYSIASCSFSIAPQVLPNVKLDKLPDATISGGNPESESKQPATQAQKKFMANLQVSSDISSFNGMSTTGNCVQLNELPTGAVVIDFATGACPPGDTVVDPTKIVWTATYGKVATDEYALRKKNANNELIDIGHMELDNDANIVRLTELCSGTVQLNCYVQVTAGTLKSILVY